MMATHRIIFLSFLLAASSCSAALGAEQESSCRNTLVDNTWEVTNPNLDGSDSILVNYPRTGMVTFHNDGRFELKDGYLAAADLLHPNYSDISPYALEPGQAAAMRYEIYGDTVLLNVPDLDVHGMRMVLDNGRIFGVNSEGEWEQVSQFSLPSTNSESVWL